MRASDRVKLLAGPYRPPDLRRGQVATCLYRNREVIVTAWSDARFSWPLCKGRDRHAGPGLLVNEELSRAIRTESAAALCYWWGVSVNVVWRWRKAFSIQRTGTPGSARLIHAAGQKGANATKTREWSDEECDQRSRRSIELNLAAYMRAGSKLYPTWTPGELAQLGTMPDEDLAKQLGRTAEAVRSQRTRRGIPTARDRRRKSGL